MTTDWLPLREYLHKQIAGAIDGLIRDDPDRMVRATLAAHRARVVEMAVDKVELAMLRQALDARQARPALAAVLPFDAA